MFLAVAALATGQYQLGSQVSDFQLTDLKGNSIDFAGLKGDTTVILFIATKCPISNDYNQRMNALYSDYSGKGVKFVAINSNGTEPAAEVASHAAQNGFPFPVYKDDNNVVADRFGAQVTPEVFVLDKTGVIRYHGHIDDQRNESKVTAKTLRSALDAMLSGQNVPTAETKAFGCTIKRKKAS
jgi:peroxiredoxin